MSEQEPQLLILIYESSRHSEQYVSNYNERSNLRNLRTHSHTHTPLTSCSTNIAMQTHNLMVDYDRIAELLSPSKPTNQQTTQFLKTKIFLREYTSDMTPDFPPHGL